MDYSSTYKLAQDIRDSEEYRTYHQLKESVMSDETTAALIREYRRLQMTGISTLLFSKQEVSQFLMAEMRLQQAMADIFKIVTEAADVEMSIPGIEG